MKKKHWIAIAASIVLLLAGVILFAFIKREEILQNIIARTIISQRKTNNLKVSVGSSRFIGLSTVELQRIAVVPEGRDSLVFIHTISASVRFWPLLTGKVKLSDLTLENGWIHLVKHRNNRNYDFLFKKKDSTQTGKKTDLGELADRLLENALGKVPGQLHIHDFMIKKISDSLTFSLLTRDALIRNRNLEAVFRWGEASTDWKLQGTLDAGAQQFNLKFFSEKGAIAVPYLQKRFKLGLGIDTLYTSLQGISYSGDELTIRGSFGVRNMVVTQAKIASGNIVFPRASIDASVVIGSGYLGLDSASTIHLKELNAHPYLRYTPGKAKKFALMFKTENTEAQNFFDSFPTGLFTTLEGIKVAGKLAYRLDFDLDENHPDDLVFDAGFQKQGFRVLKNGAENLQKINSSFLYTPYEYGKPMRSRMIGPSNPNYASFEEISPYLRAAVVASEDPNFYTHHGIDEYAFRKVIAIDYKARSFKRGASTISMQLVKNVFLSREKTISRKAEEMLITWLLENAGLSNKQRMLEVYLNLIEWAPDVYGVGEAAHFYFGKSPAALTLGESIFMTSIIPKPKAYKYSFNPDGTLKNYIKKYYRFISGNLLSRGKILASDTSSMFQISITGPAARYVIKTPVNPADTGAADSSKGNIFDQLINSFKGPGESDNAKGVQNTKSVPAGADSAREERKERRAERKKRNKGKFLGIF